VPKRKNTFTLRISPVCEETATKVICHKQNRTVNHFWESGHDRFNESRWYKAAKRGSSKNTINHTKGSS